MSRITQLPTPPIRAKNTPTPVNRVWHFNPVIDLPGGSLRNENGRLISIGNFVVAVGLSPKHFLVVTRAPGHANQNDHILEQFVGFVYAEGATVIRVDLRCKLDQFLSKYGDMDWRRCMVYFLRHFLAEDPTYPPYIPANVWAITALKVTADSGRAHWWEVEQILLGVEAEDTDLLLEVSGSLATMASRWERYLLRQIHENTFLEPLSDEDRNAIALCDRQFYQVMTRFDSTYEFMAQTIARLL